MKIKKKELELYIVWGIYLTAYMWLVMSELAFTYDTSDLFSTVRNFTFILFGFMILQNKYKIKMVMRVGLLAAVIGISVLFSHALSFLMIIIVGVAIGNIDFRNFVKFDYRLKIAILISIVLCCKIGLIHNYTVSINGIEKQSLGFSHPNTLGLFISVIIIEWLYIHFNTIRLKNIICIIFLIMGLYYIGTSRTSLILLMFITVWSLLLQSNKIRTLLSGKVFEKFMSLLPAIICLLCYLSAIAYKKSSLIWNALDKIFTTRIYWASYYLKTYGVKMFGSRINPVSSRNALAVGVTQSNSLDMAYVRIGVQYGLIVLLVFVMALIVLQTYAVKKKNWGLLIANTFFILLGIVENYIYSVAMNVFLICIIYAISGTLSKNNVNSSEGII